MGCCQEDLLEQYDVRVAEATVRQQLPAWCSRFSVRGEEGKAQAQSYSDGLADQMPQIHVQTNPMQIFPDLLCANRVQAVTNSRLFHKDQQYSNPVQIVTTKKVCQYKALKRRPEHILGHAFWASGHELDGHQLSTDPALRQSRLMTEDWKHMSAWVGSTMVCADVPMINSHTSTGRDR